MKYIYSLALFVLCLSASALDSSVELDIFGLSYHFNRDYDFNERNPGLGLSVVYDPVSYDNDRFTNLKLVVSGGFYKDSYNERAEFLVVGPRVVFGSDDSFHVSGSLQVGYLNGSGSTGIRFLPVLSVGYDRFDLGFTGDPFSRNETVRTSETTAVAYSSMVAVFLKIRVLDF